MLLIYLYHKYTKNIWLLLVFSHKSSLFLSFISIPDDAIVHN